MQNKGEASYLLPLLLSFDVAHKLLIRLFTYLLPVPLNITACFLFFLHLGVREVKSSKSPIYYGKHKYTSQKKSTHIGSELGCVGNLSETSESSLKRLL